MMYNKANLCTTQVIRMRCDELCTEERNDVLRVYDGRSADDNLIDSYSGCESIDVYFNTREIFISWSTSYRFTRSRFSCELIIEGMTIFWQMPLAGRYLVLFV